MFIYKITNILNNKIYVGQTTKSIESRWKGHINTMKVCPNKNHLYLSMLKHGLSNFKIEVLEECLTRCELNFLERYYIKFYNSVNNKYGYNRSEGGQYNSLSHDGRQRLIDVNKKLWSNPEYKQMMIQKLKDSQKHVVRPYPKHLFSAEVREKALKNSIGKNPKGEEHRNYKKGFMTGLKFTQSHKCKISKALIGNTNGKFKAKKIKCIELNIVFNNINEAKTFIGKGNIYKAIKNKTTSGGYHWCFIEKGK